MKLTFRLTLLFVLYASALLVGVAWLAYMSGRDSLRSATVSELQSTAIEKQAALNEWVKEKRLDIGALAASPAMLESAAALFAATPGSPAAREAHDRFINEVQPRVGGGEFLNIMLLDPASGQVIAATNPAEEGKFKENRPFFLNGKSAPYVQDVYYSVSLQGPAMTASAPLQTADGKLLGVLAGRLNLEEMNTIINRRAGFWQTDEAFLVNTSNLFVTQPRLRPTPAVLQQGIHTGAVTSCLAQTSGAVSALDYRGIPALIVYRWLPERGLCLIVKIDQAEALAPSFEFGRKVIVISAIALLGAMALAVLFSRGITRPIRALQSGVVRFGQGEQHVSLPESGQDELSDLAREFNRMAAALVEKDARLHEYATDLEFKVEERTAAIKQREERYRSYIELTGQIGWTTNPVGEVEEDMPSWRKFTGQREEEVKGWGWSQALHPDDLEQATQAWRHAIASKTSYEVDYRMRRYDGVYRHFLVRGVPIFKDNDNVQEWVGTCIDITELREAEEALRRFELLSEHSRDIILFMRREDGRILEANAAALQAYGYGRDELQALSIRDLRARNTKNLTADQMAQADAGGILFETVHRRKDGSSFPVEVSSQGAAIGGVRTLVSIVRDITERKRAEEEIASLSRFPAENPNPVLRVRNDGRVTYANAASEELLEMWGIEVDGYLPQELKDLITVTVDNDSEKTMEVSWNDKVYSILLVPIVKGGYVNIYGSDITARLRAEQALFDSEEKYRLIADNSNDWIYWIKPDRNFRYVSPSCERITGFTHLDFMTRPGLIHEIVHPQDRERVKAHTEELAMETETENMEFRIITKAGELRWISHSCAALITVDGEYLGRRGTNRDITERKQAEDALLDSEIKYRRLFEAAKDGILIVDAKTGVIKDANPYLIEMLGSSQEEICGKELWELGFFKDIAANKDNFLELQQTEYIRYENLPLETADGRQINVEFVSNVYQVNHHKVIQCNIRDITERRIAEGALRESEERLRLSLRAANQGLYDLNVQTGAAIVNAEYASMLGYDPETFVESNAAWIERLHPDDKPVTEKAYQDYIDGVLPEYRVEFRQKTKDGNWKWILSLGRVVEHDSSGRPLRMLGTHTDITERKQAEQALRESEAFVKAVLDNLPVGIAVNSVDPAVTFNYMNDNFAKFYRTTRENLADPDAFWNAAYEDPAFREEMKKRVLDDITSGNLERMHWVDVPVTRKGEEIAFITARNIPVPGKPFMISTVWDVTERKQTEETLQKKEAELRSLYESMTELFVLHEVVYDASGKAIDYRLLECNPAFEKIAGIPRNAAVGGLASKVYGTGEAPYLDIYATVAETGEPVDFETEFSPLGKQFHISVFSPEKRLFATLASDITERKRAEDELHQTLDELKHSNIELEQFAYVASHDLQEPLRGIAGLAQLLQQRYQGQLDSRADEYITHIVDGTQRMQTLINDLLAYSRIGRRGEVIQATAAQVALQATLENLSAAIREYGATITHDSLPMVKADATQLIQLFQNLIGNAIKFRSERPPHIHIGVADAGDAWQFCVRDNGIGIEPQYFERIFQVFQRLHTRREYKGTGIGLAICKKIIERHGGHIWLESEPGNGSAFYFTLPKG